MGTKEERTDFKQDKETIKQRRTEERDQNIVLVIRIRTEKHIVGEWVRKKQCRTVLRW